jgi:hypothetical protein
MNIKKPNSRSSKFLLAVSALLIIGSTSLYGVNAGEYTQQRSTQDSLGRVDPDAQISPRSFHHEEFDNGDRYVEWIENGHHYRQENDRYFSIEKGEKRDMTEEERRQFEMAVEESVRKSAERIHRHERERETELMRSQQRMKEIELDRKERQAHLAEQRHHEKEHAIQTEDMVKLRKQQIDIARQDLAASRASQKADRTQSRLSAIEIAETKRDIDRAGRALEREQRRLERDRQRIATEAQRAEAEARRLEERLRAVNNGQTGFIAVPSSNLAMRVEIPLPPEPPIAPEPPAPPTPPLAPEPPLGPEPPISQESALFFAMPKSSPSFEPNEEFQEARDHNELDIRRAH